MMAQDGVKVQIEEDNAEAEWAIGRYFLFSV